MGKAQTLSQLNRPVAYNSSTNVTTIRSGASDTTAITVDASQNVLVTAPSSLGYGTGAGGAVTQLTSKTTAVTLNKPTGQITTNNSNIASAGTATFQVNNTLVAATDLVIVTILNTSISSPSNYRTDVVSVFAGGFFVRLTNTSAGNLSEAAVVNFAVIKGVNA